MSPLNYKTSISSYVQGKIKHSSPEYAKQFIFSVEENNQEEGLDDPIYDSYFQKTSQIIHKYSNRVLFLATKYCGVICRFCFRKNSLNDDQSSLYSEDFSKTFHYLKEHTEIEEMIFSGGDPLTLTNAKIKNILDKISPITHIKIIRFHTKILSANPKRIDQKFADLLEIFKQRFQFIFVFHINHSEEIDEYFITQLSFLQPYLKLSQTVLLKGINNNTKILVDLFKSISFNNIKPYYLHHPDQAKGAMHFFLSIKEGREIYHSLFQHLSGWMIPQYVLDLPMGKGKIPLYNPETLSEPNSLISFSKEEIFLTKSNNS